MDGINALIEGVKLEEIMPDLQQLLHNLEILMKWAVRIGPMVLLAFGLLYWFAPPKEANHTVGFRTYFGMGSVEAWQFTQRIAGYILTGLGGVLTIVMWIMSFTFGKVDAFQMMTRAAGCLLWQIALVLVANVTIGVLAAVYFDKHGNRRKEQ